MKTANTFFYGMMYFCLVGLLTACSQVSGEVSLSDAWARATAPGQVVGAAYLTLQSAHGSTLVSTESPAAERVEIHSMTMNDGVMRMRKMDALPLPAGEVVKLEPGGFHLMLFDLKQPLKVGENLEFLLHFKDNAGKTSTIKLTVPVKASNS